MAPFGEYKMAKTPLALVKERFGDKEKLAAAVQKLATKDLWLDRVNPDRGFAMISNAKLLRLHAALEDAKSRFGSRSKLIDAVLTLEGRSKDAGYKVRLEKYPLPRLLDIHGAAEKRKKAAGKKAETKKAEPAKAAPAKASAKAAAKKPPAKSAKK
jgi:hypothetical protein